MEGTPELLFREKIEKHDELWSICDDDDDDERTTVGDVPVWWGGRAGKFEYWSFVFERPVWKHIREHIIIIHTRTAKPNRLR